MVQDFITRELKRIKILSLCLIVWTHSLVIFPIFCAFKNAYFFSLLNPVGEHVNLLRCWEGPADTTGFLVCSHWPCFFEVSGILTFHCADNGHFFLTVFIFNF